MFGYSNILLGMKVMLKLVPNHSSSGNIMFTRSIMKEKFFDKYYIWNPGFSDGEKHYPINNWVSNFWFFYLNIIEYSINSSCEP